MQAARQDRVADHSHPGTQALLTAAGGLPLRRTPMATAHVLVFPFPVQGHINCMLHFATALVGAGVHVTFLHTEHNLCQLGRPKSAAGSPLLRFASVPDGLPSDHPRSVASLLELYKSLEAGATRQYRALLAPSSSSSLTSGSSGSVADVHADDDPGSGFSPVTCVVADGLMTWAFDIAEELGIPAIAFRTASASSFLAFLSVPKLFELGDLPFPAGSRDLDEAVRGVPGMGSFLRRRDLPSFCRRPSPNGTDDDVDPALHELTKLSARSSKARALILNTTASLEQPTLSQIAPHMRDLFAIGPLHAMAPAPASSSSLWREDDGCLAWLDSQADRSVVYVSFGSLTVISHEQFRELLGGLIATGYPFLWVLRPDMVQDDDGALQEQEAAVMAEGNHRARIVAWAPQRDVLRHRAVGCFLTHAGWNSTLESVVEGVPMVCWPSFSDQQTNSRLVGAVWRNGLDMKDVCDGAVAERMVKEAMESAEIRRSAEALAQQVKRDVVCGGSSEKEFQRLVRLIRVLSTPGATTELKSACSRATPGFSQQ